MNTTTRRTGKGTLAARGVTTAIVVALWTTPALHAQTAASEQEPIAAGQKTFAASCRICHGEAGVGNRAPTLRGPKLTVDYITGVVTRGKAGTMMPSFENAFTPEQIHQVALYLRSLQRPDSPWMSLRGDAAAGEGVFFDTTRRDSCRVCHSIRGRGGRVGPDLSTKLKGKTPREIFEKIVIVPHRSADPAYANVALVTRAGDNLKGVKGEEAATTVRFYDTSVLPPRVLTFAKADIVSMTPLNGSAMPSDYASRLPLQKLLDLVAYLKLRADGKPSPVDFDDLVDARPR